MSDQDKQIEEKIKKCLDFIKKECPNCYSKILNCCGDKKENSKDCC